MNNYTVRTATIHDRVQVSALLQASYPELMRSHYDADILERAIPLMTEANPELLLSGTYYVAEVDCRQLVGCGGWTVGRPGNREVIEGLAHLRHFATHPDFIGRGVGRAIYEVCRRNAARAGATRLECYASINAQDFYEALGFAPLETIAVQLGQQATFRSMRMMRDI